MRTTQIDPGFFNAAKECYEQTEKRLRSLNTPLPFPEFSELPTYVQAIRLPMDSAGGVWAVKSGGGSGRLSGLKVIASVGLRDDHLWYHLSLSRARKMPTYKDMTWVKEKWMGDRWAIQCFVPKEEHVNVHPYCLHLWHNMTGERPFPNFNVKGQI